ncbi:gliding motility-associated peptidyl-prolyl isomerase GldI [Aquimarina sp. BL5]|uniref:gliding motility-associated peptidyl-prolyl isomerase GldI n=1 Tax=Aquimarina sp. BL5 TaxID=1714860 RepID=UPI000E5462BC|nr:gliding motility-associated peptidyl-prolyl isomerase GldI [Aquimarina sp. BL5]AXT53477.1 gliding motility-associated peptidyl-prolyl isomerase GldI [Aquimarina sp. BL5]RKN08041.1 gliding motility-associated peptidyl-prolyl isomerase GldI [Aquimarina sp. BL5]
MRHFLLFLSVFTLFFSCKAPEARKPISISSGSFINESINRSKELTAREEARIQKIIKKDSLNNYISSDGGFWYYYEKKDTISSITPKFGDIVNFNYDVKNLNGNVIYNQKEIDTVTYSIDQEDLFFGLREGLKLMKEGEIVTFLFPSYQAYGYYGDDHKIGTNIPLISRVTLNKITKQSTKEN